MVDYWNNRSFGGVLGIRRFMQKDKRAQHIVRAYSAHEQNRLARGENRNVSPGEMLDGLFKSKWKSARIIARGT